MEAREQRWRLGSSTFGSVPFYRGAAMGRRKGMMSEGVAKNQRC